jgi:murein L,D-transpeptidase YcbB/YkuD
MRVVVGRPARQSPVFSADMTYLVINPYWHIPPTIAARDLLPKIQEDIGYLDRQGIRVLENWRKDADTIDPTSVDWQAYDADHFPFKLRQEPGPYNALGRIKFIFPNVFAVYLHDTPNQALFNRRRRIFSSGCIRVESPLDLAEFVLAGDGRWTTEALTAAIDAGVTRTVLLKRPVPVHLLYMTAWVDAAGVTHFRGDVYLRDAALDQALMLRRSRPARELVRR